MNVWIVNTGLNQSSSWKQGHRKPWVEWIGRFIPHYAFRIHQSVSQIIILHVVYLELKGVSVGCQHSIRYTMNKCNWCFTPFAPRESFCDRLAVRILFLFFVKVNSPMPMIDIQYQLKRRSVLKAISTL